MSTKRKLSTKLGQPMVKASAKPVTKVHINDAKAVVSVVGSTEEPETNGMRSFVEISSDSSSDSNDHDSDENEGEEDTTQESTAPLSTPAATEKTSLAAEPAEADSDDEMADPRDPIQDPADAENAEPTFGDLVHATSNTIDVSAFAPGNSTANPTSLIPQTSNALSLTTVLSQALRTNDTSLLESCLQTPNPAIIRATIQRLSSPLASTLLSKLAERLHRRPGRSGSLMVWVQWTLVTHGGYLATQKDLMTQLRELNKVIEERARSLNSLLSLKGKLDMLEAQMQLRRSMQQQKEVDEDEIDEAVIYVENSDSEDGDVASDDEEDGRTSKPKVNGVKRAISPSSSVSEDMPNGISAEIEEEDSEESDVSDLLDDEAEETDADSDDEDDEDQVEHEEMDEVEDGEESEEERVVPPKKVARTSGMFSRGRA